MDNMGQTILFFDQNLLEICKFQHRSNYICDFEKIDQSLLNGQYRSTYIVTGLKFFRNISSSKKELSMETY